MWCEVKVLLAGAFVLFMNDDIPQIQSQPHI